MTVAEGRARVTVALDDETSAALRALCASAGAQTPTAVLALLRVLLHRLTQGKDVPVRAGLPGRDVQLTASLDPDAGFRACLRAEQHAVEAAVGREPLAGVALTADGLGPHAVTADRVPDAGPLSVTVRSDTADARDARRTAGQLARLAREVCAAPDAPTGRLPVLPPRQWDGLLALGTGPHQDLPAERTVLDLFTEQVAAHPGAPAAVCGDRTYSYAELDGMADRLAARLAAAAPTGPERVVALLCARTEWMLVSLLAILKTGSAFLPLDPEQPALRLRELLADSGAVAVLADASRSGSLSGAPQPVVTLGRDTAAEPPEPPLRRAGPADLAYVVYTSGSTGAPKGVMVEHLGILNTVRYRIAYYGLGPGSRVLQVDPVHADAGISDVLSALCSGAPLVVLEREQLIDPDEVAAVIRREDVTHVQTVPSLYQLILDYAGDRLPSLRQVVLGGERLTAALAARHHQLLPDADLFNEYGPSEDSVATTLVKVEPGSEEPPVGKLFPNKTVDLLDEHGALVPLGALGEICIGGVGLARGYLGNRQQTEARFVANPVRPGQRMYRTGDLGRWLPDGSLVCLGRIDDQVQIRGHRVEPGEVTEVLAKAPGVRSAAVVAWPGADGSHRLVAYVVGEHEPALLRAHLADRLPAHMVPDAYVPVTALPVTSIGKLDRSALPAPPEPGEVSEESAEVELTAAQLRVAEVWSAVLGHRVRQPDADLFALGGHSLTAARIAKELGVAVSTVFANPTVRLLAGAVPDGGPEPAAPAAPAPADPGAFPLSRAQRRVWLTSRRTHADRFIISDLVRTGRSLRPDTLRTALTAVVERQELLRAQVLPEGASASLTVLDGLPGGVPLRVTELPGADPDGPDVREALRGARSVTFDLERAPLFEVCLIRGPVGGDLLTVSAHHLIYDGASVNVLLDDLFAAYEAVERQGAAALPPLEHQYRDWAAEERAWLVSEEATRQEAFWKERLQGVRPVPDLVDSTRRGRRRGLSGLVRRTLPAGSLHGTPATPYAVVVTAFTALVHRVTGVTDVVLGFPASLRHSRADDALIGYFANAVPLRLEFAQRDGLGDLLGHVGARVVEAYEHGRLPFDALVERLGIGAQPGRSVLLDLGVSWENATVATAGWQVEDVLAEELPADSDMWLYASVRGDLLHLDLTYDRQLVTEHEAAGFADDLVRLVSAVVTEPHTPVGAPGDVREEEEDVWSATSYDF
ncbi:amino acid adenylation domain-containing protein [Streptomyces actinomycinicus]|uniref:Amino acid adenylation domain-containing protein n=1 Tax=Streptomyces actinomycinicus TaxID=1695166 RepID=A0A937JKB3_9ACTN|nr:amino acid adenylation domain-containing protein [Streptomyces actinomycinicus]MBL1082329.1 amino acid adenylation domain-containing protein [Streptomyces actinomycinicus]